MTRVRKVLAFSDMHGERKAVDAAEKILKGGDFDAAAYLGDFSMRPGDSKANIDDAQHMLERLSGYSDIWSLFGNCDSASLRDLLEEKKIAFHNNVRSLGNAAFIGWGGSHPTPFNTPSEFPEELIESSLDKLMEMAGSKASHLILLTHEPPHGTNADKLPFGNVGSKSIRRVIERHQPVLNVCGHIHEARSVDAIGNTRVINIGQASKGHFLVIYIGKDVETEDINIKL